MSTVRVAEERLRVEVSIEPKPTEAGVRILLVMIQDEHGSEWSVRVALANTGDGTADVVGPTVVQSTARREDIFDVATPLKSLSDPPPSKRRSQGTFQVKRAYLRLMVL